MLSRIRTAFESVFPGTPMIIRSPGRVNLIGEHTDYNLGYVLPAAVDKAIWFAMAPRQDRQCRFYAMNLSSHCEIPLDQLEKNAQGWPNYLIGILKEMQADGHVLGGVDCVFGGDVPIGSGMSSSAALECGFAFGLNELFQLGLDRIALTRLGQRSENHFVGVACGIMDQFASLLGQDGRLIRLDCRDLSYVYVPFTAKDMRIVLCDSQVRRALATSEYNTRRKQCEAGVRIIAATHPTVKSLRDVTVDRLEEARHHMDPVVYRRCSYVVQENQRVLDGCEALANNDFDRFGALMSASHRGLEQDYEVSCPELDTLAHAAITLPGVLGSRMMGAGFGGCTISLVKENAISHFEQEMGEVFRSRLGKAPIMHICQLTAGTERLA